MMIKINVEELSNVATDGISNLLEDMINDMNDEDYETWLNYHFLTCEEKSILGYSLHGLWIGRKL
jgi:hypothetical protein